MPTLPAEARATFPSIPKARAKRRAHVIWRTLASLGAVALALVAFTGFLHTKSGHPLLMRLAGAMGCPMGGASAAQVDALRRAAVAKERGQDPAPARPALGFVLDRTTIDDVRAWARSAGATCTEERESTLVKCTDVPPVAMGRASSAPAPTELTFGFSPSGPLVSVATLYSHRSSMETLAVASAAKASLEERLGPPHQLAGSFVLAGTTATLAYRFRDYAVDVTSSNIPGSGYAVREQYMSAM